jgi:hypothetical protein
LRTRFVSGVTILLVLACCLAPPAAFAGGRAERESRARLAEAQALIDARRYNDAILLLAQIVKEDPERFDSAEQLMNQIRAARELFNKKLAELNSALFEQNDIGKGLELISELEALDPYPSQSVREILARAREGREQVYYLTLFEEIMNRAKQELDQGRCLEAASIYLDNLGIGREVFDRVGYGNIVTGALDKAVADLRSSAGAFADTASGLDQQAADLLAAPAADSQGALAAAAASLRVTLLTLIGEKAGADRAGETLRAQNQQIHDTGASGRFDLHLRLLTLLVFGRSAEANEGLSNALKAYWLRGWGASSASTLRRAEAAFDTALQGFRAGEFPLARRELDSAAALFRVSEDLQALWPVAVRPGVRFAGDFAGSYAWGEEAVKAAEAALADFLGIQVYLRAIDGYRKLMDARTSLARFQGSETVDVGTVLDNQGEIAALVSGTSQLAQEWDGELARLRELAARGPAPSAAVAQQLRSEIDSLRRDLESVGVLFLGALLRISGAELEAEFRGLQQRSTDGVELQEGREVALEPIRNELGEIVERPVRLERFPARALAIYEGVSAELAALNGVVSATLENTLRNQDYLDRDPNLKAAAASLQGLADRARVLSADLAARTERARQAALQAERNRQEGYLRVSQARAQIASRNLMAARESLARAREALDRSLEFQEDPEVRRVRDQELAGLAGQITDLDTNQAISDVRQFIDQGRLLYGQGDYLGAQRVLLRAQKRWAEIRTEENPEVSFWLNLVDRALSATAGREIPFTDPLYNEMSQLLNLAIRDYLEGKRLLELQERRAALESFRRAEENIGRIRVAFPANRKARVLTLQILTLSDPETLRTRLAADFADAQRMRGSAPQDAYGLVEDIEQVAPAYPGLAALKLELEYSLGLKARPTAEGDRTRARALFGEANALYLQRTRSLYPLAVERLDEALRLFPDYTEAKTLKDRINRELGGERQDILPGREQQVLADAQRLYRQQQYLRARLLVDDLLSRTVSASHPDVADLDRRLAAAGYPSQVQGR